MDFAMINRPLRFCMITTFYPPYNFGGDGIFVHRLSNELAKRGHHVDVIHCLDAYNLLSGRKNRGEYDDHPNVKVHGLKSGFGFLSPLATHQTGIPFFKSAHIKKILDKDFDVIHYHNISLVGGPKIMEYGRAIKLYTMHEYWLICPTHLLLKFNRVPCNRENCLLCLFTHKRPAQWWRYFALIQRAVRHIDAFIHLTDFSRDIHRQKGLELPFFHLPFFLGDGNGEPSLSHEPQRIHSNEHPYFLFVGRLEKLKGLHTLIPVFRRYRKAYLLVAGEGRYGSYVRKLAKDCPNIVFLNWLPYDQLEGLYRGAVALIIPSLYYDISPLVIIEAFKHKIPVIARNLGGMPEIVAESRGGFLYDTEEDLIAAMDQLLSNPSHRDNLGQRGFETYKQKWTVEAHLQGYFSIIEHIAKQRGLPLIPSS